MPESSEPAAVIEAGSAGLHAVKVKVGAGEPLAVKVKLPALPTPNVVAAALVMAGATRTVMLKVCAALVLMPPLAVPPLSCAVSVTVAVPPSVAGFGVKVSAPPTATAGCTLNRLLLVLPVMLKLTA